MALVTEPFIFYIPAWGILSKTSPQVVHVSILYTRTPNRTHTHIFKMEEEFHSSQMCNHKYLNQSSV